MTQITNSSKLVRQKTPTLLLDLHDNLIRIHRNTLSLLGNPAYIQFLINPDLYIIGIKHCKEDDYYSERIRWNILNDKNKSCEFHSKVLIKNIRNAFFNTTDNNKYCILGKYIDTENLTIFDLTTCIKLIEGEEAR